MLKIKTLEEFKKLRKESCLWFQETPDGYSYYTSVGRITCTWKEEYERYCNSRKNYIEKITPLCNFLKENQNQAFSIQELREKLNDDTIKSGTINTLIAEGIAKKVECKIINEKGQEIILRKITWADGNAE
jgi:hypothetical protein